MGEGISSCGQRRTWRELPLERRDITNRACGKTLGLRRYQLKVDEAIVRTIYRGIAKGDLRYVDLLLTLPRRLKKSGNLSDVEVIITLCQVVKAHI